METQAEVDWTSAHAALWRRRQGRLRPVRRIDPVSLEDLAGIDRQRQALVDNTRRFLAGEPSNHALLWGARGTGKSSLVKAVFNALRPQGLRLVQIDRRDLEDLPEVVDALPESGFRFILFCDDLALDPRDPGFGAVKSLLEGTVELPPEHVRLYATSNRRHLVPEPMAENLEARVVEGEIHHGDGVEERLALADRFGLWLSFPPLGQAAYLALVERLFAGAAVEREVLHREALRFALARGSRSGRTARQFYNAFWGRAG